MDIMRVKILICKYEIATMTQSIDHIVIYPQKICGANNLVLQVFIFSYLLINEHLRVISAYPRMLPDLFSSISLFWIRYQRVSNEIFGCSRS